MEQSSNSVFFDKISKNITQLNQIDSNPLISGLNLQLLRLKEGVTSKDKSIKPVLDELKNSLTQLHEEEEIDQPQDPLKKQLFELKMSIINGMQKEISDYFVVVGDEIYINTKRSVIHNMDNRITKKAGEPGILGNFIKSLSS